MKIVTELVSRWSIASKTQPIKAKPLISLIVDRGVVNKFLLDTLEGREPLGDGVVVCIGVAGDSWQQTPKKLLAKYTVTGIDNDGWMECNPLPDNAVNVIEITSELLVARPSCIAPAPDDTMYGFANFYINGHYGDDKYPAYGKNVQWGKTGDFVCQNRTDPTDVWIVKRSLFLNTYVIKN
jgi:hypothetical protein